VEFVYSRFMSISRNSLWLETKSSTRYKPLDTTLEVDVAVVGGGITGVTAAYLLSQRGLSVALLEKETVARGATGWTTAMIIQYIDTELETLIDAFGHVTTKKIWDSGKMAIDTIERIAKREKINCEFIRSPYFVYASEVKQKPLLTAEQKAAKKIGVKLTFQPSDHLAFQNIGSLVLPNQAKFHPVLYVDGLIKAAQKNGTSIYENTEVTNIEKQDQKIVLQTKNGTVIAKDTIIATYNPIHAPLSLYFKKGTYTTYMIVAKIGKNIFEEAMYQDLENPYHYFRIDRKKSFDLIIAGGEDHRSQIPVSEKKSFRALEEYIKKVMNGREYTITHRWSGPILEPTDGLPSIGPLDDPHILYATGFSGTGMTFGTIAAIILSDFIQGKKHDLYPIFSAKRKLQPKALFHKAWDYTEEFFGGAVKNTFRR
jgi:glycine/D-amino acid oxidase-like deaminating enzyme